MLALDFSADLVGDLLGEVVGVTVGKRVMGRDLDVDVRVAWAWVGVDAVARLMVLLRIWGSWALMRSATASELLSIVFTREWKEEMVMPYL